MNATRRDARLQGRVRTGRCGQGDIARWLKKDSNVDTDILSQAGGRPGRMPILDRTAQDWLQAHINGAHQMEGGKRIRQGALIRAQLPLVSPSMGLKSVL